MDYVNFAGMEKHSRSWRSDRVHTNPPIRLNWHTYWINDEFIRYISDS